MTQTNRITEGILWKEILLFFIPILIGAFFQQMYSIAGIRPMLRAIMASKIILR